MDALIRLEDHAITAAYHTGRHAVQRVALTEATLRKEFAEGKADAGESDGEGRGSDPPGGRDDRHPRGSCPRLPYVGLTDSRTEDARDHHAIGACNQYCAARGCWCRCRCRG